LKKVEEGSGGRRSRVSWKERRGNSEKISDGISTPNRLLPTAGTQGTIENK
jgi:hypothetical protein